MAVAVKAFIVNNGKLLIMKRAKDDVHKPGIWEIPGGRIGDKEDLMNGLIREVKEETGLSIEINRELSVRDFVREDRQEIEMHIFLCCSIDDIDNLKLSEEHSEYEWIEIEKCKPKLTRFFHPEVDLLLNLENDKWP